MRRSTLTLVCAAIAAIVVAAPAAGTVTQTPKRGGTAVVGVATNWEPACLNPFLVACWRRSILGAIVADLILARPFNHSEDRFRPDLVSGVTVTKKPVTVTFHLRPDARWSDGRPVTAFDMQFTHRAALRSEAGRAFIPKDDWLRKVTRVRALDAKTFRMWVPEPVPLPAVKGAGTFAGGVLPRHIVSAADLSSQSLWRDRIVDPKTGRPIGSGPFLMQSRKRGHSITLVRNPRYWGPHTAYLDKLVFRFLPASELAEALRRGEIDVIGPGNVETLSVLQEIARERPPGVTVAWTPGRSVETFIIRVGSGGHPALKNTRVRQALAYGIDRAGLARLMEEGLGRTTPSLGPQESLAHLAQSPYHKPNWSRYRHRPALARRLLAQAGCRLGGDGIRVCDGKPLTLRIGTTAQVGRPEILAFVQERLGEIGVGMRQVFYPRANEALQDFEAGNLDLGLWAWFTDWALGGVVELFECGGPTGYCSRLVNRELDNADRVVNDDARAAALNRADRLLSSAVPGIPLYTLAFPAAHRTSLRIPDLDPDILWNAQDWWLAPER